MTGREQFELVWKGSEISDDDTLKQIAWAFWKASREALEVELPSFDKPVKWGAATISIDLYQHKKECEEAIRAAGIKVIEGEKKNG